jgi:hypothetical protein
VVDAIDDVQHLLTGHHSFDRAGHDHSLHAQIGDVGLERFRGFDLAAAFEHQLHAQLLPGHGSRITGLAVADRLGLHLQSAAAGSYGLIPAAVHRVEFQQVGGGGGIPRPLVDVHQLDIGAAPEGPKNQPPNAAEAVDTHSHAQDCHWAHCPIKNG